MRKHFKTILQSKDLRGINKEVIENVLDSQLTNEVFKEIPIVKSILAVSNLYTSISDQIFIKKTLNVLLELEDTSADQRALLLEELDDKFESGAEKIIMAINHLETIEKCRVFGRLCKLKAIGRIGVSDFLRLTKVLQDSFITDLELILQFGPDFEMGIYESEYSSLLSLGLICQGRLDQKPIRYIEEGGNSYGTWAAKVEGGEITPLHQSTLTGNLLIEFYTDLFPESL